MPKSTVKKFTTSSLFTMECNTLIKTILKNYILTKLGDLTFQLLEQMVFHLLLLLVTFADPRLLADAP